MKEIIPKEWEVDVVYIWCDSNNPEYKKNRNYFSSKYKLNSFWSETRDHNEISNSIMSVRKNMSWVRDVYVCAPKNHVIKDFDADKYWVKYVTNEDILGEENCPNFNSHSLELYTHKIKWLSEYYLQLNDDFFISNKVDISDFFNFSNWKIKYYYENYLSIWSILSNKTQEKVIELTNDKYYFWPVHFPRMFCKKHVSDIVEMYWSESISTKVWKFRSNNDLQLVYLYWYYLLNKNEWEFIFVDNIIQNKSFLNIRLLFNKIFSEGFFSTIKQIYFQIFYKNNLHGNKIFSTDEIYSLINLSDNYIENKKSIDFAFDNKVKFICLNDSYKTKDNDLIDKINEENFIYFYNKLNSKWKK